MAGLQALAEAVRSSGEKLDDADLSPSDAIIPPEDLSLEEARELLAGEGLIPDVRVDVSREVVLAARPQGAPRRVGLRAARRRRTRRRPTARCSSATSSSPSIRTCAAA